MYLLWQDLQFRDEWTEELANQTCTERIKKFVPSELPDIPGLSVDDYIQSCILDIKVNMHFIICILFSLEIVILSQNSCKNPLFTSKLKRMLRLVHVYKTNYYKNLICLNNVLQFNDLSWLVQCFMEIWYNWSCFNHQKSVFLAHCFWFIA